MKKNLNAESDQCLIETAQFCIPALWRSSYNSSYLPQSFLKNTFKERWEL